MEINAEIFISQFRDLVRRYIGRNGMKFRINIVQNHREADRYILWNTIWINIILRNCETYAKDQFNKTEGFMLYNRCLEFADT